MIKQFVLLLFINSSLLFSYNINEETITNILTKLDISKSAKNNKKIINKIKYLETKELDRIAKNTKEAKHITDLMRKELIVQNMDEMFLALSYVESNFNPKAKSHVKASGLWQIMSKTGKDLSLKQTSYVDERYDIKKATQAASNHLKRLKKEFDKWYLAIMAYNAGEGRVMNAIIDVVYDKYKQEYSINPKIYAMLETYKSGKLSHSKKRILFEELRGFKILPKLEDMISKNSKDKYYLPKETRDYIVKMVSYSYIFETYRFVDMLDLSEKLTTVEIQKGKSLYILAKQLEMDPQDLFEMNGHIKKNKTNKKTYIYLPMGKLRKYSEIKYEREPSQIMVEYSVKRGDTLGEIAMNFGIDYKKIAMINNISSHNIKIGQRLIIPLN